jgi:hypothetical protein
MIDRHSYTIMCSPIAIGREGRRTAERLAVGIGGEMQRQRDAKKRNCGSLMGKERRDKKK